MLSLSMISTKTFYDHKKRFVDPVIVEYYHMQQKWVIDLIEEQKRDNKVSFDAGCNKRGI